MAYEKELNRMMFETQNGSSFLIVKTAVEAAAWEYGFHKVFQAGSFIFVSMSGRAAAVDAARVLAEGGSAEGFNLARVGVTNTVTKSESILGHIFRDARGHVNPSTVASQNRYISLFEEVANNPANLNSSVLNSFQRTAGGFKGYSKIYRNGQQVWTQTLYGKIINAGVNIIPK